MTLESGWQGTFAMFWNNVHILFSSVFMLYQTRFFGLRRGGPSVPLDGEETSSVIKWSRREAHYSK